MPATYTLIASNTLSSAAASVTFSSIPGTYTDLVLRWTARSDLAANLAASILVTMNSDTSSVYSYTYLLGDAVSASSARASGIAYNLSFYTTAATATNNTFGQGELYYPNYAGSANKVMSTDVAHESNGATAYRSATANLWRNTAAITSITLTASGSANFVSGSSFFLYGIKNS